MGETSSPRETKSNQVKRCIVCAEDIKNGAYTCIHCGSHQNWRRHLNFSQSILALVLAIMSVSTILIPNVAETFSTKDSNLTFTVQAVDLGQIAVLVSNTGSRPGSIRGGRVSILDKSNPISPTFILVGLDVFSQPDNASILVRRPAITIQPGAVELALLKRKDTTELEQYKRHKDALSGYLNVSLTNFHGQQSTTDNMILESNHIQTFLGLLPAI